MPKKEDYLNLVEVRKECNKCNDSNLTNPSKYKSGKYDLGEISPWSTWQGNIDSKIIVVGEFFGDTSWLDKNGGYCEPNNVTNKKIIEYLELIGFTINLPPNKSKEYQIFMTNAVCCLKKQRTDIDTQLSSKPNPLWYDICGNQIIKPLIEIISPQIIIPLGFLSSKAVLEPFGITLPKIFRESVEKQEGYVINDQSRVFPVYHPGSQSPRNRKREDQQKDWLRIKKYI